LADAPKLSTGDIVSAYPYLWLWQRDRVLRAFSPTLALAQTRIDRL
jgi:hypothetical protein